MTHSAAPEFVRGWWEAFENGEKNGYNSKTEKPDEKVVVCGPWKDKINTKNLTSGSENPKILGDSDYGKSVKFIIETKNFKQNMSVDVCVYSSNNYFKIFDVFNRKTYAVDKVWYDDEKNRIIIPVYLDLGWGKDRKWYEMNKYKEWYNYNGKKIEGLKKDIEDINDRFYVEVSTKVKVNGKMKKISEVLAKDTPLIVWPQPSLIMHAEAEVKRFHIKQNVPIIKMATRKQVYDDDGNPAFIKNKLRPIPATWVGTVGKEKKERRGYWYRLGRAYDYLGTEGTQIIKGISAIRKEVKYIPIEVGVSGKDDDKYVQWRGNQRPDTTSQCDFEHPAPDNRDITEDKTNVVYDDTKATKHFRFHVKKHHEDALFIHGGIFSEGCFVLGDSYVPQNGDAKIIWDTMGKLKNVNHMNGDKQNDYENGVVKITNHTKDNVTKLDYNYPDLHNTGFDNDTFVGNPNAELTEKEIDGITPLEDDEILQFLYKSEKNKDDHKDYFTLFDQEVVKVFHDKYKQTSQKKK